MTFYLQKTFVCEYSGKSGLDYFEALDHEYEESQKTQEKFPDVIKPKVLRACQYRKLYKHDYFYLFNTRSLTILLVCVVSRRGRRSSG